MRVVFDTNIYISALVFPGGQGERAILRIIDGKDELFISRAILDELLRVLSQKFSRDREELARVAVWISEIAELVEPQERLSVVKDQADNGILECGVEAKAHAVVTGDKELLALGEFRGIKMMSLREYLEND